MKFYKDLNLKNIEFVEGGAIEPAHLSSFSYFTKHLLLQVLRGSIVPVEDYSNTTKKNYALLTFADDWGVSPDRRDTTNSDYRGGINVSVSGSNVTVNVPSPTLLIVSSYGKKLFENMSDTEIAVLNGDYRINVSSYSKGNYVIGFRLSESSYSEDNYFPKQYVPASANLVEIAQKIDVELKIYQVGSSGINGLFAVIGTLSISDKGVNVQIDIPYYTYRSAYIPLGAWSKPLEKYKGYPISRVIDILIRRAYELPNFSSYLALSKGTTTYDSYKATATVLPNVRTTSNRTGVTVEFTASKWLERKFVFGSRVFNFLNYYAADDSDPYYYHTLKPYLKIFDNDLFSISGENVSGDTYSVKLTYNLPQKFLSKILTSKQNFALLVGALIYDQRYDKIYPAWLVYTKQNDSIAGFWGGIVRDGDHCDVIPNNSTTTLTFPILSGSNLDTTTSGYVPGITPLKDAAGTDYRNVMNVLTQTLFMSMRRRDMSDYSPTYYFYDGSSYTSSIIISSSNEQNLYAVTGMSPDNVLPLFVCTVYMSELATEEGNLYIVAKLSKNQFGNIVGSTGNTNGVSPFVKVGMINASDVNLFIYDGSNFNANTPGSFGNILKHNSYTLKDFIKDLGDAIVTSPDDISTNKSPDPYGKYILGVNPSTGKIDIGFIAGALPSKVLSKIVIPVNNEDYGRFKTTVSEIFGNITVAKDLVIDIVPSKDPINTTIKYVNLSNNVNEVVKFEFVNLDDKSLDSVTFNFYVPFYSANLSSSAEVTRAITGIPVIDFSGIIAKIKDGGRLIINGLKVLADGTSDTVFPKSIVILRPDRINSNISVELNDFYGYLYVGTLGDGAPDVFSNLEILGSFSSFKISNSIVFTPVLINYAGMIDATMKVWYTYGSAIKAQSISVSNSTIYASAKYSEFGGERYSGLFTSYSTNFPRINISNSTLDLKIGNSTSTNKYPVIFSFISDATSTYNAVLVMRNNVFKYDSPATQGKGFCFMKVLENVSGNSLENDSENSLATIHFVGSGNIIPKPPATNSRLYAVALLYRPFSDATYKSMTKDISSFVQFYPKGVGSVVSLSGYFDTFEILYE